VIFHSPFHLSKVNTSEARALAPANFPDQRSQPFYHLPLKLPLVQKMNRPGTWTHFFRPDGTCYAAFTRCANFFRELRAAIPEAEILLGEVTALPPSFLARHHESSSLPELLLFHSLSGQGVLEWETWHCILDEIPYSLAAIREFD
jgi:hypothetical protein